MDAKELAIALARAEKEADVIDILQQKNLWNDFACWRPFGDNDNNYSTIGNQQSKPDAALVEKLINSVDAILMKECMTRGIDMTSPAAPQSISDALSTFFGIREGQIAYLDTAQRNAMSKDILVAATGMRRGAMNLIIADKGEGQTPKRMPETILSISKNNKLRVPFVQGKFNMGGTGVLPFCGENRFQLVISKRCPSIPNDCQDETFNSWSVTMVRREEAREGRRSTMFTYLTDPNGNVLSFEADSLPIIPLAQGKGYEGMPFGTFFKLYNYAIQGYKSNILMDFNYRLSMLMPDLAHPIRLRECRDYEGHSFETTLSGLHTRLFDDRENNIEEGFPASSTFNVDGQAFKCSIYVFKAGKSKNYREDDGILYTINGQTHACISQTFFNKVNLSYLADSLLVLVDCSAIDVTHREDMFMNSRDRLRDGAFVRAVQDRIKEILKEHQGLKKLQNERRAQAVQNRLNDDRPLQNVLNNILAKSPVLSKILLTGSRLTNPFNTSSNGGNGEDFVGKMHPTFFKLREKHREEMLVKHVPTVIT